MDVIYGINKLRNKLNNLQDKHQNQHFGCHLRILSNFLNL